MLDSSCVKRGLAGLAMLGIASGCGGSSSPSPVLCEAGDSGCESTSADGGSAEANGGKRDAATHFDAATAIDSGGGSRRTDSGRADAASSQDASVVVDAASSMVEHSNAGLLSNYLPCDLSTDCPIGVCVTSIPLNRKDSDGTDSVSVKKLWPSLTAKGVCSHTCSSSADECAGLMLNDPNDGSSHPFTCQIVTAGVDPYAHRESSYPYTVNADGLARGQAFGGICRPPFELHSDRLSTLCKACKGDGDCSGGHCARADGSALSGKNGGVCLESCKVAADCALGFTCNTDRKLCVLDKGTCGSCRDDDGDGYGLGFCGGKADATTAYDCNDADKGVYYHADPNTDTRFKTQCATADINCDGLADDAQITGPGAYETLHCGGCFDACAGAHDHGNMKCIAGAGANGANACKLACDDGYADCDSTAANGCEVTTSDATKTYYLDADGDGYGNPDYHIFDCANSGAPANYVRDNTDCDDNPGDDDFFANNPPGPTAMLTHPGATETCDSVDRNCNGDPYDAPEVGMSCMLGDKKGVCRAGMFTCGTIVQPPSNQPIGSAVCTQQVAASPEVCNNLDDDCDGTVDNIVGTPCTVAGQKGECAQGVTVCSGGRQICKQTVMPTTDLPLDGKDSNCDGWDGNISRSLFVWGGIGSGGNGTLAAPYNSLATAVANFNPASHDAIYVVADPDGGVGGGTITLQDNMRIIGGMTRTNNTQPWTFPDQPGTRSTYTVESAAVGMSGSNITNVLLYNMNVSVVPKQGSYQIPAGVSSYGLRCSACNGLRLQNTKFSAAAGGGGANGANSSFVATAGTNGGDGQSGYTLGNRGGGGGGSSTCGTSGGRGGDGYYYDAGCACSQGGQDGTSGTGSGRGSVVSGGGSNHSGDGGGGNDGWGGVAGTAGASGVVATFNSNGDLALNFGGVGGNGGAGGGASGGGGGGLCAADAGGGGGGGGGGGCGGGGGSGGQNGGGSVGALFRNTYTYNWSNALFEGKSGGSGGMGGAGSGGAGGGQGGSNPQQGCTKRGGVGGKGGGGAGGGGGGGGAGGPSFGLVLLGSSSTINASISNTAGWGTSIQIQCSSSPASGGQGGLSGAPGMTTNSGNVNNHGVAGNTGNVGAVGELCANTNTAKIVNF